MGEKIPLYGKWGTSCLHMELMTFLLREGNERYINKQRETSKNPCDVRINYRYLIVIYLKVNYIFTDIKYDKNYRNYDDNELFSVFIWISIRTII